MNAVKAITDCMKRLIGDFPTSFGDTIPAFNYMGEVNWYLAPPETPMPWKLMNVEGKQLFEDACVGGLTAEEMRADSERLFESAMGNEAGGENKEDGKDGGGNNWADHESRQRDGTRLHVICGGVAE